MQYAIIGDIHSSKEDLEKVLYHINKQAPDAVLIGTGDLFECTISKRNITERKYTSLSEVMLLPDGFKELLTFPSVKGNQEERILLITEADDPLLKMLSEMPEKMELGNAEVIHGHQWTWGGEPWSLLKADTVKSLTFYGHSHNSGLMHNGKKEDVLFEHPYFIGAGQTLVNVGAVVDDREWVLFDSTHNTVSFMKVE
ncbi:metallophosphoesterase family protein [Sporosarcina thermotolerans]|uniref:Metallophosphoesterase family protein n=1 Tax=Sporosarcina thermotolerans TaxID=633404 RepID=A0AAW9A4B9_9BACL|nr:metallophosphoesterase family protein [Sporosarcina thermotolerans]MDW0115514.1 metallophosphoesterase family protein [Sporosarcina thermotolerans]WHT47166.1 metallophosphoesterase family protein [Sporosarcina thermotolerans]